MIYIFSNAYTYSQNNNDDILFCKKLNKCINCNRNDSFVFIKYAIPFIHGLNFFKDKTNFLVMDETMTYDEMLTNKAKLNASRFFSYLSDNETFYNYFHFFKKIFFIEENTVFDYGKVQSYDITFDAKEKYDEICKQNKKISNFHKFKRFPTSGFQTIVFVKKYFKCDNSSITLVNFYGKRLDHPILKNYGYFGEHDFQLEHLYFNKNFNMLYI